jgi:hypothetical protein
MLSVGRRFDIRICLYKLTQTRGDHNDKQRINAMRIKLGGVIKHVSDSLVKSIRHYAGVVCLCWLSVAYSTEENKTANDLTPALNTVFDRLFQSSGLQTQHHNIPYPFSKLIKHVESELGFSLDGNPNRLVTTLIPVGRCINRFDASPNYFQSPRIVVAVDTEPLISAESNGLFMKDRLFMAYQPASKRLDIISYNDTDGRFEFQVVKNYQQNRKPKVVSAKRSNCTVCHQNNGPIFPQPLWSETDDAKAIANRLNKQLPATFPLRVIRRGNAGRIDSSTNRAGLMNTYQEFWQSGCQSESWSESVRCRAGLFSLMLQQRLSRPTAVDHSSQLRSRIALSRLSHYFNRHFPDGLAIPTADIDNQNPLNIGIEQHLAMAENLKQKQAAKIRWGPHDIERIVGGLGMQISSADLRRLDERLFTMAKDKIANRSVLQGQCRLRPSSRGELGENFWQSADLGLECDLSDGSISSNYQLLGEFRIHDGMIETYGGFARLMLGSRRILISLSHFGGALRSIDNQWQIDLKLFNSRHHHRARLPSGAVIDRLLLSWPKSKRSDRDLNDGRLALATANVTLLSIDAPISTGITQMLEVADPLENAFAAKPFDGHRMMSTLIDHLN